MYKQFNNVEIVNFRFSFTFYVANKDIYRHVEFSVIIISENILKGNIWVHCASTYFK